MLSYTPVFDWESLPVGSLVVDVGGGIGTQMVVLGRRFGELNLVVQDRDAVCVDAEKVVTIRVG